MCKLFVLIFVIHAEAIRAVLMAGRHEDISRATNRAHVLWSTVFIWPRMHTEDRPCAKCMLEFRIIRSLRSSLSLCEFWVACIRPFSVGLSVGFSIRTQKHKYTCTYKLMRTHPENPPDVHLCKDVRPRAGRTPKIHAR